MVLSLLIDLRRLPRFAISYWRCLYDDLGRV